MAVWARKTAPWKGFGEVKSEVVKVVEVTSLANVGCSNPGVEGYGTLDAFVQQVRQSYSEIMHLASP